MQIWTSFPNLLANITLVGLLNVSRRKYFVDLMMIYVKNDRKLLWLFAEKFTAIPTSQNLSIILVFWYFFIIGIYRT